MANKAYPTKGKIISMALGNTTAAGMNDQYRVLKANGSIVKVVALYEYSNSAKFNAKTITTNIGSLTVQKYSGSTLDILLNTTFYNSLLEDAKNAILLTENVKQDVWYWGVYGNKTYRGTYNVETTKGTGIDEYVISPYLNDNNELYTEDCGSRFVYALSIQDIFDYLGVSPSKEEVDPNLTSAKIWKMLWNTESGPQEDEEATYPWLRSAYAGYSEYVWRLGGLNGFITYGFHDYANRAVRPVFTIDLSKLSEDDWNIVG